MINRTVVQDTINIIEDLLDTTNADKELMAQAQTILNFWRLYLQFAAEEIQNVE